MYNIKWFQFVKSFFKLWLLYYLLSNFLILVVYRFQPMGLLTGVILEIVLFIFIGYTAGLKIWPSKPSLGGALVAAAFMLAKYLILPLYIPFGLSLGLSSELFRFNFVSIIDITFFAFTAFLGGKLYKYIHNKRSVGRKLPDNPPN